MHHFIFYSEYASNASNAFLETKCYNDATFAKFSNKKRTFIICYY